MANPKGPSEGGSGGKRGHSNMEHWGDTAEVKDAARTRRRIDDAREVTQGTAEHEQYQVRIYCHESFDSGSCQHEPSHPFIITERFPSIRTANDRGGELVADASDETVEWEVLDASGHLVC